jgi:hypothetical protein
MGNVACPAKQLTGRKEVAEMSIAGIAGAGLAILLGVLFIAYIAFVLSALIGVVGSRHTLLTKIVWVLVIFAVPFLGSILWHIVGKKDSLAKEY